MTTLLEPDRKKGLVLMGMEIVVSPSTQGEPMRVLMLIVLLITMFGCASSKPDRNPVVDGPPIVTGPDAKIVLSEWNRQMEVIGLDGSVAGGHTRIAIANSAMRGRDPLHGPYSCDEEGCWHGITYLLSKDRFAMKWPKGRKVGLINHETLHAVLYNGLGITGHPEYVHLPDGRRLKAADIARWRWPSRVWNKLRGQGQGVSDPWNEYTNSCRWVSPSR